MTSEQESQDVQTILKSLSDGAKICLEVRIISISTPEP